jgi:hypothetical protein
MISMDKKYRTRDGREVRLLCVDGPDDKRPVVGVLGGRLAVWKIDGSAGPEETQSDLIEYHEPDIRTIWVNVYENYYAVHTSEEKARKRAQSDAIAIAQPVTFEVKRK